MLTEPTGKGRKLQSQYSGPYVVDKINSPHLVTLRQKSTGKLFKTPFTILMTYNVSTKSVALFNEKKMSLELTASKLLLINKQYKHSKCI
jgi:hypothetical protein